MVVYSKTLKLWDFMGQSNARGVADIANASAANVGAIEDVVINVSGGDPESIYLFTPTYGFNDTDKFGWTTPLARLLAANEGERIAIFKYAIGGTALAPSRDEWYKGGDTWNDMVTARRNFLNELAIRGFTVQPQGITWYQGEADSQTEAFANAYGANFTQFIADIRAEVGVPDYKVVAVPPSVENPASRNDGDFQYQSTVVAAINAVATADSNVSVVAVPTPIVYVEATPDGVHNNAATNEALGAALYTEWTS